jgi:hypothetical protein
MPIADKGRLWLHKVSNGTQLVAGFSSDDIQVFELPRKGGNPIERRDVRIESDTLGGFQEVFDAKGKSDFVIAERSGLNVPSMEADIPSDLKNRRNKADYLIIAPREFSNTAELLRDFRKAKFRDATIVWLDDIYDEFSAGRTDPFAIADFLKKAQKKWSLAPSVVVLLGKGTLDHKNRMGFNDSFLPSVMTDTPWLLAASDERLLGGDGLTSVIYGRIPITSDDQGLDYVAKLKNYEMADPVASHTGVLVADNPDDAGDFHTNSDALAKRLSTTLGFASTTKLYHPNDAVRAEFVKSSTWDDAAYINYDGHGSATQLGNGQENFINTSDAAALANGKLPIFTALTCSAGDFANPGVRSLTAAMVLNANGGAISAIAPTGYSIDQDAQALGNALVDNLFHGSTSVGEALKKAKQQSDNQTNDFMPRIYMVVGEPGVTPQPVR